MEGDKGMKGRPGPTGDKGPDVSCFKTASTATRKTLFHGMYVCRVLMDHLDQRDKRDTKEKQDMM